jgi:hypothetical protein
MASAEEIIEACSEARGVAASVKNCNEFVIAVAAKCGSGSVEMPTIMSEAGPPWEQLGHDGIAASTAAAKGALVAGIGHPVSVAGVKRVVDPLSLAPRRAPPAAFAAGKQRETAKKQRAFRCYFDGRLAVGPGFPPKTGGGSLIISGRTAKNSETARKADRFSCWRGPGHRVIRLISKG